MSPDVQTGRGIKLEVVLQSAGGFLTRFPEADEAGHTMHPVMENEGLDIIVDLVLGHNPLDVRIGLLHRLGRLLLRRDGCCHGTERRKRAARGIAREGRGV